MEDPGTGSYDLCFRATGVPDLRGEIVLSQTDGANGVVVALDGAHAEVLALRDGQRTGLSPAAPLPQRDGPVGVAVRRRPGRVDLVVGGELVTRGYTDVPGEGSLGYRLPDGVVQELLVQPIDEHIEFGEDFAWEADSQAKDQWQAVSGEWTDQKAGDWTNAAAEARQTAAQGANLFAYVGRADGPALVVSGMEFWSNYSASVAVRGTSDDPMGLVAYYSDPASYVLFRVTSQLATTEDADQVQLVLCRGESRTVLAAAPGGFLPEQWYRLGLRMCDERVEALVDGRRVLSLDGFRHLARGKIGLYCEGKAGVKFDDVEVREWRRFGDDFAGGPSPAWSGGHEGWAAEGDGDGRKHVLRRTAELASTLIPSGSDWTRCRFTADVDLSAGSGGLLAGYRDPGNYLALEWDGLASGALPATGERPTTWLRLVRVLEGERARLGEVPVAVPADGWATLSLVTDADLLRAFVGGKQAFEVINDELEGGRVGLIGSLGACFDDVRAELPEENEAAVVTAQFTQEDTMREWASVAGAWVAPSDPEQQPAIWWNKGDYYGDVTVELTVPGLGTPEQTERVLLLSDGVTADSGYTFELGGVPDGGLRIGLSRQGAPVAETVVADVALPVQVKLAKRGWLLSAAVEDETRLVHLDRDPLTGSRIGLWSAGLDIPPSNVLATSSAQRDYPFSSAPVDWITRTGIWDVTSRWTCSPQWTWFSGVAEDGPAAMWTKREFEGDVTVELYASIKMGLASGGASYKHPNDLNITLLGDGANPSTGYSFILGGPLNTTTQIRCGDRLLAETSDPSARLPRLTDGMLSTNEFHRKWWQVRAQKQGNRLRMYYENRLVLDTEVPADLEIARGHMAVWTWDNGIMVARCKVYGAETGQILEPRASQVRVAAAHQVKPEPNPLRVTSATHPALIQDFEWGRGEFEGADGPQGAVVALDPTDAASGGTSLAVCNENAGGSAALVAVSTDFDARQFGRLSFAYKIGPELKLNFMFRTAVRDYIARFTGPDQCMPGQVYLGAIDGVVADGQWHRASFDLRGRLYRYDPELADTTITEVRIGQFYRDRLLSAGITGNPAGATYHLDDFRLCGPGDGQAEFTIADATNQCTAFAYAVDRQPGTDPGEAAQDGAGSLAATAKLDEPGDWWLHARGRRADGTWTPVLHHAFVVDGENPKLGAASPADGTAMAAEVVAIGLTDASSGIDPSSIRVRVGAEEYSTADTAVTYDPVVQVVRVDLARLRTVLPAQGEAEVAVVSAADYAGLRLPAQLRPFRYAIDRTLDRTEPPAPAITMGAAYLADNDFESSRPASMGEFAGVPGYGGAVGIDRTTAASGESSLRVYCTESGPSFHAYMRQTPFDAGRYRLVSFDYKVDEWIRVDLVVKLADGTFRTIKFTDSDSSWPALGSVANVQARGVWAHAEVPLFDLMRQQIPGLKSYVVQELRIGGSGWPGNPRGASFHLDNFRILAVASGRESLAFQWYATDPAGIAGASYELDAQPDTVPDSVVDTTESRAVYASVPEGDAYFHVRLVDGAGNWGPTTHHRCFLDSAPVVASAPTPAPGALVSTSQVSVSLQDQGLAGVDPSSIVLSVAGQQYPISSRAMSYDAATGKLLWEGERLEPEQFVFGDQQDVPVSLVRLSDFAGNPLGAELAWVFKMDYTKDLTPPPAPAVESSSHGCAFLEPFEGSPADGALGECSAGAGMELEVDTTEKASGSGSLKATFREGNALRVLVHQTPFDAAQIPYLAFDYCVPAGVQIDVAFVVNGSTVLVNFTDNETGAVSRLPGIIADGKWHRVEKFDISAAARQVVGNVRALNVSRVVFGDFNAIETPLGSSFWIDNLTVYRPGSGPAALSWRTTDPTGIAGYSHCVDDQPGTVPDEQAEGLDRQTTVEVPGDSLRFFHIRARDGAGHWGPTTHFCIAQQ